MIFLKDPFYVVGRYHIPLYYGNPLHALRDNRIPSRPAASKPLPPPFNTIVHTHKNKTSAKEACYGAP